ncbi:hypothetical protein GCM10007052_30000 [Halioglobus japonicus]|nr:hypothetical protein GCM10007052_30000 [Halioglobus japonicus]
MKAFNTSLADAVDRIILFADEYIAAKRNDDTSDARMYLTNLDGDIGEFCDDLTAQAEDIWRQISTNFGAASLLKNKIKLNKNALATVKRIVRSLELIDLEHLRSLGNQDRELRGFLSVRLASAIEHSRNDLSDAIVRLNASMFRLTRLAERARLINRLVGHYNLNPSFEPEDYTARLDVPRLFQIGSTLRVVAAPETRNPAMESLFSEILVGLRNEAIPDERQTVDRVPIGHDSPEMSILEPGPFKQGIQRTYVECLKENTSLTGRESYRRFAPSTIPPDIWFYALVAEYNAMPMSKRKFFNLEYDGRLDETFSGNFHAKEVKISPC